MASHPTPRPNVPSTLCIGAIESAVTSAAQDTTASAIPPTTRERASVGTDLGPRHAARPTHAIAVIATRIGTAQAFGSSYGPAALANTARGTPRSTENRPA